MCVSIFSTTLSGTFPILRRTERDIIRSGYWSSQILVKLSLFRQIFEKYSYIKFNGNPSSGNRVVPFGRTKLILAFRNFANAPKNQLAADS